MAHLFAREYTELGYISAQDFDAYFKFAIVRNPYQRALSEFNYRKKSQSKTVRDFICEVKHDTYTDPWRHICPQHMYVKEAHSETLLVDKIIKFEQLASGWSDVSRQVFGTDIDLPHRNVSKKKIAPSELSTEDKDFIAETYADDFKLFGYER